MDIQNVRDWEQALDKAELSPLTANLPKEPAPGDVFEEDEQTSGDGTRRKWIAVEVIHGSTGGRWAYWAAWQCVDEQGSRRAGVGANPQHKVIADKIFNGDAANFVGMLGVPYVKVPGVNAVAWVLVEPRAVGPRVVRVREEPAKERYERSREVHDVETGTTTELP